MVTHFANGNSERHAMTTNKMLLAAAAVFACCHAFPSAPGADVQCSVRSPGGEVAFSVRVDGKLRYDLSFRGRRLIADSALGFDFKGEGPMASDFELLGRPSVDEGLVESWRPVVASRHSDVRLVYNRMTLRLREGGGDRRRMDVTVNAYDGGVAFRYTLYGSAKLGERRIVEERTEYRVPETSFAWVGHNPGDGFVGPQESRFDRKPVKDMGSWCLVPLLVEVDAENYLALTSAALDGYPGYLASWRNGAIATSLVPAPEERGDGGVKARFGERFDTAWRVVLVGDSPGRFIESEIIQAVNAPCALADTSWIRPGISAWDHWWSGDVKMEMPVVMNTRAAELAKFVVYESPLTMFCEHPRNVLGQPGSEFVADVPTVWDDTRFLGGYPGEWIAVARRSGDAWYVGVMGGDDAREVTLDLGFAGAGRSLSFWADGEGPRDACRGTASTDADGKLTVSLAPGGGYVAVVR